MLSLLAELGEVSVGSVGLTQSHQKLHHKLINGALNGLRHNLRGAQYVQQ